MGAWHIIMGVYGGGGFTGPPDAPGLEYTAQNNRLHYTARENRLQYTAERSQLHYTVKDEDE